MLLTGLAGAGKERRQQLKHDIFLFSRIVPTLTQSRDVRYSRQAPVTEIYLCIALFFSFFDEFLYSLRHFEDHKAVLVISVTF